MNTLRSTAPQQRCIFFFFLSVLFRLLLLGTSSLSISPLIAAMANPLRQRLGALLSRPLSSPVQTAAGTKRFFASKSHAHDDAEESLKWRSITIAAYIMCVGLGIYTLANEEHHDGHNPQYSYLRIRNKQFPWGPDGLFEHKHESHGEH